MSYYSFNIIIFSQITILKYLMLKLSQYWNRINEYKYIIYMLTAIKNQNYQMIICILFTKQIGDYLTLKYIYKI